MKFHLSLLIICSLCFAGCRSNVEKSGIFSVNIDAVTVDSLDLADFADSITYIDLKTSGEEFIGHVINARIKDSLIVIKDNNKAAPVTLFDIDGNFISRIGRRGQGPGEYTQVTAIDVDRDTVYVYDMNLASALMYDTRGNYLGQDSIGYGDDFAVTRVSDKKHYLLANYNISRDDMSGIFLICPQPFTSKKILERRDKHIDHNRLFEFSFNNGTIRLTTLDFEYKSLRLEQDSLVCEYEFDISPLPSQKEIENWNGGYDNFVKHYISTAFYDAGRWLIFAFAKKDNLRFVLFDKTDGTYKVAPRLKNSIDGNNMYYYQPTVTHGALLCVTIPEDDDNPQLMLAHLKN